MGAFSGLEIACWDILGKARGRPVHALWGGRLRERLRSYTYLYPGPGEDPAGFYNDPDASAACAARMVEAGFTAVKFDPAGPYTIHGGHQPTLADLDRSEAFCRRLREAVGRPGRPALRDARAVHAGGGDPAGAADRALRSALVRGAGAAGPAARPRAGGGGVAGADRGGRAADDQGGVRDAAARRRASGSCSRASGRVGGLLEARKVAVLAEGFGAQVAPHLYAGPIAWAAAIQLGAVDPELPDPRDDRHRRRLPCRAADAADRLGGGLRAAAGGAGARGRDRRGGGAGASRGRASGCTWR